MQLSRLLILLVAQVAHSCYEKHDISIHSPNDVPLVSESDQVELFFLRAELFKAADWTHGSPLFGALNGYHSGKTNTVLSSLPSSLSLLFALTALAHALFCYSEHLAVCRDRVPDREWYNLASRI